jgi:hypothetical protein
LDAEGCCAELRLGRLSPLLRLPMLI